MPDRLSWRKPWHKSAVCFAMVETKQGNVHRCVTISLQDELAAYEDADTQREATEARATAAQAEAASLREQLAAHADLETARGDQVK